MSTISEAFAQLREKANNRRLPYKEAEKLYNILTEKYPNSKIILNLSPDETDVAYSITCKDCIKVPSNLVNQFSYVKVPLFIFSWKIPKWSTEDDNDSIPLIFCNAVLYAKNLYDFDIKETYYELKYIWLPQLTEDIKNSQTLNFELFNRYLDKYELLIENYLGLRIDFEDEPTYMHQILSPEDMASSIELVQFIIDSFSNFLQNSIDKKILTIDLGDD